MRYLYEKISGASRRRLGPVLNARTQRSLPSPNFVVHVDSITPFGNISDGRNGLQAALFEEYR